MGRIARRTLYKRLPYKVWDCCRLETQLKPTHEGSDKRVPLSRERVLRAAIAVADAAGVRALTIRSLAAKLGVKPMSVYYYFANKSEILDGIVDVVFSEIDLPTSDGDWQSVIRHRAISARRVLARHPWVIVLLESRKTPGPATLLAARERIVSALTPAASATAMACEHLVVRETSTHQNRGRQLGSSRRPCWVPIW